MENLSPFYVQLLKRELSKRQSENKTYSLREFARSLDLSATTLSQILSHKKGLSEKTALKVSEILRLQGDEKALFLLSVRSAHSRNSEVKMASKLELAELKKKQVSTAKRLGGPNELLQQDSLFLLETSEVRQLVLRTEVAATYRYGGMNPNIKFRILHILKDKVTGEIVPDFIQIAFSEKTRTASTVYFLRKPNGKFKTYFGNVFDGNHQVTGLVVENQNTEVVFDKNHLPTIEQIYFLILSSNQHAIGKMEYTLDHFKFSGTLVDFDQPNRPLDPNFQILLKRL